MKPYVTDTFMQPLVWEQIKAIGVTLALAIVGTADHWIRREGCPRPASERGDRNVGLDLPNTVRKVITRKRKVDW